MKYVQKADFVCVELFCAAHAGLRAEPPHLGACCDVAPVVRRFAPAVHRVPRSQQPEPLSSKTSTCVTTRLFRRNEEENQREKREKQLPEIEHKVVRRATTMTHCASVRAPRTSQPASQRTPATNHRAGAITETTCSFATNQQLSSKARNATTDTTRSSVIRKTPTRAGPQASS